MSEDAPVTEAFDEADNMCPRCVTPWKCNGPHRYSETPAGQREASGQPATVRADVDTAPDGRPEGADRVAPVTEAGRRLLATDHRQMRRADVVKAVLDIEEQAVFGPMQRKGVLGKYLTADQLRAVADRLGKAEAATAARSDDACCDRCDDDLCSRRLARLRSEQGERTPRVLADRYPTIKP